MAQIHRELSTSKTCGVGYNSIRFDDEVSPTASTETFMIPTNVNGRMEIRVGILLI